MNVITALVYWVIVLIWVVFVGTVAAFYFNNRRIFGTTRLLLAVLAVDGLRNVIENIYFGFYFGSKFGLFNPSIAHLLGNPRLLILPKLANIATGSIVLCLLLLRWLPQAIREHADSESQAKVLHELASIDAMTGLHNRREFMLLAQNEWLRCQRYQRALSLVMLDIDHFKNINDHHGHDAGDQVITGIARICRQAKRNSDIAGRLGGEEFAILLPETNLADAHNFAERLREHIAIQTASSHDGGIAATVSIGLSEAGGANSVKEFFKQADGALYEAKRSGRNRVCRFALPKVIFTNSL